MDIEIPHDLGKAEARRRIEAAKRRWAASLVQLDAMNGTGGPA